MVSIGDDTIETAALGRPFQLGMLYDCRKDVIVPGITLWDREQLQQNTTICSQNNTEFKVTTSDSINEKANNLKVDGGLKLSLMGGLVSVSGAARYFNDHKKSFLEERLTLHYRTSSTFQQLTMNHLGTGNMAHHDVFAHDTATHVVTAVLYGAEAYFVFDREVSSDEHKTNVAGEVKIVLDKLKIVDMGAQASLSMNENEKNAVRKFNCTFYGDFNLPSNPSTFEGAIKVYTDLPKMLGTNGEHAVPLKVWLYPLVKLNSRAARLQRNVTADLIRSVESVIEALNTTEMKCADLLKDSVAKSFKVFQDRVEAFQKCCSQYKLDFMMKLGNILPAICGGKQNMSILAEILRVHEESPFNANDLKNWIITQQKGSNIIKPLLKQLQELGAEVDEDIEKYLLDLNVENVVSYSFSWLHQPDLLLRKQQNYLKPSEMQETSDDTLNLDSDHKKRSSPDRISMRKNLNVFMNLMTSNNSQSTKFIISSLPEAPEPHSGSCIMVYESVCDVATCFEPPTKLPSPVIECVSDYSITVHLGSTCDATVQRKLLYKMNQEKDWKYQPVHQDWVTLMYLQHDTDYELKYEALAGKPRYTAKSDIITFRTTSHDSNKELQGEQLSNTDKMENGFVMLDDNNVCAEAKETGESKDDNEHKERKMNDGEPQVQMIPRNKYLILQSGNTLNSHKTFLNQLNKRAPGLQEVDSEQECDFILVFSTVLSRAGTDIEAALNKLNQISETKFAVLVVLHHTINPDQVVPDSRRAVSRKNTITADFLFHEDQGLLQCPKNEESMTSIINYIKTQEIRQSLPFRLLSALSSKEKKPGLKHPKTGNKYFIVQSRKTLNSHKTFLNRLNKRAPGLQGVDSEQECDFILVFCTVVSQPENDIEAALNKLNQISGTKPAALVVLHHTHNPDQIVADSKRWVRRQKTITVDCVFHEDQGLLDCQRNHKAIAEIIEWQKDVISSLVNSQSPVINKKLKI